MQTECCRVSVNMPFIVNTTENILKDILNINGANLVILEYEVLVWL